MARGLKHTKRVRWDECEPALLYASEVRRQKLYYTPMRRRNSILDRKLSEYTDKEIESAFLLDPTNEDIKKERWRRYEMLKGRNAASESNIP